MPAEVQELSVAGARLLVDTYAANVREEERIRADAEADAALQRAHAAWHAANDELTRLNAPYLARAKAAREAQDGIRATLNAAVWPPGVEKTIQGEGWVLQRRELTRIDVADTVAALEFFMARGLAKDAIKSVAWDQAFLKNAHGVFAVQAADILKLVKTGSVAITLNAQGASQ